MFSSLRRVRDARALASSLFALALSGCATVPPDFDVPKNAGGFPATKSIVERIECELIDLVRNDADPEFVYRTNLLAFDYETAMSLSLETNDTGGLAPTFSFPYGMFGFNAAANLSQSRDDSLNITLLFSMRDLARGWKNGKFTGMCPAVDTNLAGDLGLKRSIAAALATHQRALQTNVAPKDLSASGGEFSGSIAFTVNKGLSSVGPTWTLNHFVGPGGLASASEVNSDKLTFGFAEGVNALTPFHLDQPAPPRPPRAAGRKSAVDVLNQQLNNDVGNQLNQIRNALIR